MIHSMIFTFDIKRAMGPTVSSVGQSTQMVQEVLERDPFKLLANIVNSKELTTRV